MKHFNGDAGYYARMPLPARVVYTLFLVLLLGHILSALALAWTGSGMTSAHIAAWYRGDPTGVVSPEEIIEGKSLREVLEITHYHATVMPILFLILAHLFALTSVSGRVKGIVIGGAFLGYAGEIALPLLVFFAGPGFASLRHLSRALLLFSYAAFIVVPLREMWGGNGDSSPGDDSAAAR